ncbi:MAG: matrixin family metalloprotease, partial [Acidobacteriota bacterium]
MNSTMKKMALGLVLALVLSGAAQATGILYTTSDGDPKPLTWDTSNGPIPAYTDGGGAFTYDFDGVTPFITIERANEITQFALDQWSNVATSTFEANVVATIEDMTGIADVTADNALDFYENANGYGMWVLYDADGSILEEVFGISRSAILGISFPERADANGNITESTTLLNGWYVSDQDTEGNRVAGVFTHELGHAINLGHTQVNGHIAYYSYTFQPLYPGVPNCSVDPVYRWNYPPFISPRMDPAQVETMYPIIGSLEEIGEAMSYVTMPDDVAAISNL